MHRFYNVYVPAVPFCSAVFCPNFHPKPGIRISFCLGHSGLYPRRYPSELPVCLCGCPDCHEPDKAVPVFIPAAEKRVFCSDLSASPLFRCKDVLLRGTHCRYALLLLFQSYLLPDLQKISQRRRTSLTASPVRAVLVKKNVPWHILAPRRGCLGNHLPLRRVRILAEHFYRMETKFPIR